MDAAVVKVGFDLRQYLWVSQLGGLAIQPSKFNQIEA